MTGHCSLVSGLAAFGFAAACVPSASFAAATSVSILPLGDSITDGAGNSTNNGGYRVQMVSDLVAAGYTTHLLGSNVLSATDAKTPDVLKNNDGLHAEGHGGFAISDITNNLDASNGKSGNTGGYWLTGGGGTGRSFIVPQYTLLMIGTNDIINDYGAHSDAKTKMNGATLLAQMQSDMTALCNKILSLRPTTNLVVSSIAAFPNPFVDSTITGYPDPNGTEADQTDYGLNHYVIPYNAWLKTTLVPTLKSAGKGVSFVDSYADFIGYDKAGHKIIEPYYGDYGLHPNAAGYALMGTTFASGIRAVPEPGVAAVLLSAAVGLGGRRRSRVVVGGRK